MHGQCVPIQQQNRGKSKNAHSGEIKLMLPFKQDAASTWSDEIPLVNLCGMALKGTVGVWENLPFLLLFD